MFSSYSSQDDFFLYIFIIFNLSHIIINTTRSASALLMIYVERKHRPSLDIVCLPWICIICGSIVRQCSSLLFFSLLSFRSLSIRIWIPTALLTLLVLVHVSVGFSVVYCHCMFATFFRCYLLPPLHVTRGDKNCFLHKLYRCSMGLVALSL